MVDYTTYTDDDLKSDKDVFAGWIDEYKSTIQYLESELAAINTELRRRAIDAFWQANEGLRLEVGDKLLVTDEAIAVYGGREEDRGRDVAISTIYIEDGSLKVGFALGVREIELPIARRMRLAYLASVQEAQP